MVLIAGFRAGLAGLNLVYPENRALKPSRFINIFYKGLSWVSWVLKKYELGLAGLAGFEKIKVDCSWVFQVSTYN